MARRAAKKKEDEGNKTKGDWSDLVRFHYYCLFLNRALTECSLSSQSVSRQILGG